MRGKQTVIISIGGLVFLAAGFNLLWSIFPLFGNTLPHLLEEGADMPFKLSALLVSLVTGVLGVIAMFIFSFLPLTFSEEHS